MNGKNGVGNGNRTRNRRSHSPVLCQLSYSHRRSFIIAMGRTKGTPEMGAQKPPCCAVSQSEKVDPGTQTRNSAKAHLDAPDADILESQRAQARGVEQVLSVDNERFLEQLLDPVEIESAKFGPAGADDQGVRSLGHRIR